MANLAVALAQTGKRVIAVSCDLRKPRLHRFFDLPNDVGLTSILTGEATLKDAVQRCEVPTLRVLSSGPVPPNPADLLGSDEMQALLDELRQAALRRPRHGGPSPTCVSSSIRSRARSSGVS